MKHRDYDKDIIPILRRISATRKARAYFMRRTTANLMDKLDNAEQDAMVEIALAYRVICSSIGLRQWRYGDLLASIHDDDKLKDTILRFREWSKHMARNFPDELGLCLSICTDEETLYKLSRYRRARSAKILQLFKEGLREWMSIRI